MRRVTVAYLLCAVILLEEPKICRSTKIELLNCGGVVEGNASEELTSQLQMQICHPRCVVAQHTEDILLRLNSLQRSERNHPAHVLSPRMAWRAGWSAVHSAWMSDMDDYMFRAGRVGFCARISRLYHASAIKKDMLLPLSREFGWHATVI